MNKARNYSILCKEGSIIENVVGAVIDEAINQQTKEREEVAEICDIDVEALNLWIEKEENDNWLAERYTCRAEGIYLHKSERLIEYNTKLKPSEAYSVKTEMNVSWKSLAWLLQG